jgi:hypothetical protein
MALFRAALQATPADDPERPGGCQISGWRC